MQLNAEGKRKLREDIVEKIRKLDLDYGVKIHLDKELLEDIKKQKEEIKQFNEERDWDKFHSPENLAKSISIEAGELLECFQWDSENYNKEEVCEELADVFTYCIQMAMKLGVNPEEIILKKL